MRKKKEIVTLFGRSGENALLLYGCEISPVVLLILLGLYNSMKY